MNNLQTIKKVYETFGRGDLPALFQLFDPNIEWTPAEGHPYSPEGKPWVGIQDLAENFFKKIGPNWNSFGCNPIRFHDAGDRIVVEGRYFGVHKNTGKKLDAQFCHIWRLSGGKVLSFQQYVDTARLQEVVGFKNRDNG